MDEDEADVSHAKEELILELKDNCQGTERQLLDVVKKEEKCYAVNNRQHSDVVLVRIQVEIELMKGIANIDKRMSQTVVEVEEDDNIHINDKTAGIQRTVSKYVPTVRDLEDNLLFESKIADKEKKRDIAEGDIFKDIQKVWVAAISTEISRTTFEARSGVKS